MGTNQGGGKRGRRRGRRGGRRGRRIWRRRQWRWPGRRRSRSSGGLVGGRRHRCSPCAVLCNHCSSSFSLLMSIYLYTIYICTPSSLLLQLNYYHIHRLIYIYLHRHRRMGRSAAVVRRSWLPEIGDRGRSRGDITQFIERTKESGRICKFDKVWG